MIGITAHRTYLDCTSRIEILPALPAFGSHPPAEPNELGRSPAGHCCRRCEAPAFRFERAPTRQRHLLPIPQLSHLAYRLGMRRLRTHPYTHAPTRGRTPGPDEAAQMRLLAGLCQHGATRHARDGSLHRHLWHGPDSSLDHEPPASRIPMPLSVLRSHSQLVPQRTLFNIEDPPLLPFNKVVQERLNRNKCRNISCNQA